MDIFHFSSDADRGQKFHRAYNNLRSVKEKMTFATASNVDAINNQQADAEEEFMKHSRDVFSNPNTMRFINSHMSTLEAAMFGEAISLRCYEIRESIEADRKERFFLDMFTDRGLFHRIRPGIASVVTRMHEYSLGQVAFIGDKTKDWPTTGAKSYTSEKTDISFFGKAVEWGQLELWQAAEQQRDIVSERIEQAMMEIDYFLDYLIANGSPLHHIYGLLNHPNIPIGTLPPTTGPNAPSTAWPDKYPAEVISDLLIIRDQSRTASMNSTTAQTLIMADDRYSYISVTQANNIGDTILSQWLKTQQVINGGMTDLRPFIPYDTAGPGGTPIAVAGTFTKQNIEMPLVDFGGGSRIHQTQVQSDPMHYKVGFASGLGSVMINKNRFKQWNGI